MYDWLIQDTTVYDPASTQLLEHHDLAISGCRIAALAPTGTLAARQVLDGRGQVAMPGLINCHAHSAMVLFRGVAEDVAVNAWFNDYIWRYETNLSPEDVYWGMKLAAIEMIEAGVTAVADHYFFADELARACLETGLRAHLAPTLFEPEDGDLTAALALSRDFVARYQGQGKRLDGAGDSKGTGASDSASDSAGADPGRLQVWLGPHSPYLCSSDTLTQVRDLAQELGVGIHLHVSETASQVEMSVDKHGMTPVAWLEHLHLFDVPVLIAHATHATLADIDILAKYSAGVAHCPKTFLKLASGIALVTDMLARGVPVGLGTDGAASNNTLDILEQARLMALLQKHERQDATVLNRHQALEVATSGAAQVLGEPDLGSLQLGKLADVVLLDLEAAHMQPLHDLAAALLYAASARDVRSVFIHGDLVMRERVLTHIDKAEVLGEVKARASRLRTYSDQRLQTFPGQ
jgi:5-methylthioadenosine/S-adenosylhomocysteine deaminase